MDPHRSLSTSSPKPVAHGSSLARNYRNQKKSLSASQQNIIREAKDHFAMASGVLKPAQFVRNTQKRLMGAGLSEAEALTYAKTVIE